MISHKLSKTTLFWVCLAHILILLATIYIAHVLAPTPQPKMLEMIGLPDNINPANGEPSAQQRGPAIPNQTSQPSQPPSSSQPPAPSQPPVQTPPTPPQPRVQTPPETTPPVPVKTDFPTEPVQPKPPRIKPTVQVNLSPTVRSSNTVTPSLTPTTATPRTHSNTAGNANSNGVSANSIERSLSNAIGGGNPNAGIHGGTGDQGTSGSPTGNINGDWYKSLIKNTIERRWMKPQSTNPNLTATVKISVLADGTIQYLSLVSSSGDTEMDNSVISAVRAAGKVSMPPPAGFKTPYEDTVVFRLKGDL